MGKALVVSATIVIIILVITGATMWFRRQEDKVKTAVTPRQARLQRDLLNSAAAVLSNAGVARTIEETDMLSPRTQAARDKWLRRYEEFTNKETNA